MVNPIPDGLSRLVPCLTVDNAKDALEFYQTVLEARIIRVHQAENSLLADKIMHAELQIGEYPQTASLFLQDKTECCGTKQVTGKEVNGMPISLHLYVPEVDAVFARAIAAGVNVLQPVSDMFWGDRMGQFVDPFGYVWTIATHKEKVSDEEIKRRAKAHFAKAAGTA